MPVTTIRQRSPWMFDQEEETNDSIEELMDRRFVGNPLSKVLVYIELTNTAQKASEAGRAAGI